ncbi:hypothetical protein DFJ58DRAFT_743750 [Suillus subalutaceus]|uniref:uncharacterized protein n=1 Tax=Suillus subalutaceus TaxID=48586 RepID=UPI001B862961|nr:uncharacterized protein DFJ58DRAFT_743750 [Suillus subalutaceus]KAG1863557.1 hypothetical protein DFJ58DRAFT_743750 [Suillus subalutaceus]
MRFTSQFVAFTSICTIIAIVLPPPADAAYIATHPSGNRVATAYEADKPRTIISLPRLTAGHVPNKPSKGKGKLITDTPSSRFFRFSDSDSSNPLAGILGLDFSHVHGDDVHPPFSLRDASSRRPTPLSRRSSALVHGAGGNNYLVSRGAACTRSSKRRLGRRGTSGPVSGIIDIVSGEQGRHLASLALDPSTYNSTNTTSTNSTSSDGSFPLNASSTNGTQFYLVDANDSSFSDPANTTKHVMVQTDIFDSLYCATFDPNPSGPEPMTMEMCRPSESENDVKNLDYSYANGMAPIVDYTVLAADPHKSQIFEYNPSTGVIKPVWTNSDGSTSSHAMFVERDVTTSSTTGSNTMSSAGSSTTSSPSAPQPTTSSSAPEAQNVTLVFRPSNLTVSAPPPSTDAADSSAVDVVTTTITTTVVYTATATPSSSSSSAVGSPVAAVAALTVASSSCSSTSTACSSTSTPSPAVHAAAAASSAGSPSQATSTGSASSTTTQATSSSMPPSPSVHAAIVASSPGSSFSEASSTDPATGAQATSPSIPPSPSVHAAIVASIPGSSSSQAISMGSATTSQATSTSQPVRGSLEIEFVPIADSPSSAPITSSSPPSSSSSSTSTSPSSSSSVTPSRMNAAAIASVIANSRSSASTASNTNTSSSSVSTTVVPTTTAK